MAESNWQRLIRKISIHSNIRQDVVEHIMKSAVDVIITDIVNKGKFNFMGLFSIKAKEWKGYSLAGKKVDDHQRLTVTLSKQLKELWKIRFEQFDGDHTVINKDNWKTIYKTYRAERTPSERSKTAVEKNDFNPFFDDDEEDF